MRVLVVEDDPDLGRQLSEALGQAGYAVDLAPDGEEGHFLGETEPYDAAVLDLGLPKMDGVRVLEKWRAGGKDMPVLILPAIQVNIRAGALPPPEANGVSYLKIPLNAP